MSENLQTRAEVAPEDRAIVRTEAAEALRRLYPVHYPLPEAIAALLERLGVKEARLRGVHHRSEHSG